MSDSTQTPVLPPKSGPAAEPPAWVMPVVRRAAWRVAGVVITVAVAYVALSRARSLVSMLIVALFFGIAMHPGVTWLSRRFGWRRGAATGVIFLGLVLFVVGVIVFLIPATVQVAQRISDQLPGWLNTIGSTFHVKIGGGSAQSLANTLHTDLTKWVQNSWRQILGLAGGVVGLVFELFTIAMFTFYFAADYPAIQHTLLRRRTPERQQRLGWALDTAVKQTSGYFYSRLLLMVINGILFFFAMLLVGVPWLTALPMSVFEAFVSEFIPAVGTYIGAAVPILVTLGLQGIVAALILLGWTIVYQQLENYFLSPRISAKTMELNGGVAFAAALAGGAIAGPMGAFMALPVAAWITSFLQHYGHNYPLAYHSADEADPSANTSQSAPRPGGEIGSTAPAGTGEPGRPHPADPAPTP